MVCAGAVTAQFVAGKAVRDALFLAHLDVTSLPAMVVVTSIFSFLLVALTSKGLRRVVPGTFVPLAQLFIELFGWRGALQALAACTLVLGALFYFVSLRGLTPRPLAAQPSSHPIANRTVLLRAARSPVFWCLVIAFSLYIGAFGVITFHLIPLLVERGVSIGLAVSAIAIIGPAQVAGRVVIAAMGARSGAHVKSEP